jgi:hypothetical protein
MSPFRKSRIWASITMVLILVCGILVFPKSATAGINGDQVRIFVSTSGTGLNYVWIGGSNQHDAPATWKSWPGGAKEVKTNNWWWKYHVSIEFHLTNGVKGSCFMSLWNRPFTNTESIGIDSNGNKTSGGGPGSSCSKYR